MEEIENYVERDMQSLKHLAPACDYCKHRPEDSPKCDICDPVGTQFEAMTYEDIRNATKNKFDCTNCKYYEYDIYEEPCLSCELTFNNGEVILSNKEEETEDGKH